MIKKARRTARAAGVACVLTLALGLTACGSSDSGTDGAGDPQAALEKGGTITVWAWEPTLKQVAKDFEAEHPKVKVKLVNAGTGDDQYKALQNAISAGSGVPDVAQIEYYALGQFSLAKSLTDLSGRGAGKLASSYSPGPWNAVEDGGKVYALPMDSGPMALFYNKDVFDKHHIKVPATWDEYVEAARKLHKADPHAYIANDTGDAGFTTSLIWQAGWTPLRCQGHGRVHRLLRRGDHHLHQDLAEAPRRRPAGAGQQLERRVVQGPVGRHHRHPCHRRLDALPTWCRVHPTPPGPGGPLRCPSGRLVTRRAPRTAAVRWPSPRRAARRTSRTPSWSTPTPVPV